LAYRERCLNLAWHRGREAIRRNAPGAVFDKWRHGATINGELAARQLQLIRRLTDRARAAGVTASVVKGLPLSALLYQHWALRGATDVDFCVPDHERHQFQELVISEGLTVSNDFLEGEAKYRCDDGAFSFSIEVHSELLDEPPLLPVRLPLPVPELLSIDGQDVFVVGGPTLQLFLALELVAERPLLIRSIDFMTLLASSHGDVQREARQMAARTRLTHYFDWALRHAKALQSAADASAADIGAVMTDRREHAGWRLTRLADGPGDALFCALEWLWPSSMRRDTASTIGLARGRVMKLARLAARRSNWRVG
jgi:hypothetical protein